MTRLLVHTEGQTEEEFVNTILAPHLYSLGFMRVEARLLGAARSRKKRGGICSWNVVKNEIYRHLSEDGGAYATTFVDYYAMPAQEGDWPGRHAANATPIVARKAEIIHQSLVDDFSREYGAVARRFFPYVAMHEFEALLFSDARDMANGMGMPSLSDDFSAIRGGYITPEHINDSPITAPSKRISSLFPGYQKVVHGNLAAEKVTLRKMRGECEVFGDWLNRLEAIVVAQ